MAAFEYQAVDSLGKKKNGILEADSARQVRQRLREQGYFPLEVQIAQERKLPLSLGPSISIAALSLLTRQLATLVASKLPLEECLQAVAQQSEASKVRSMLLAIRAKVLEGYSLAEGLQTYPRVFSQLYHATVAAGEQSGQLAQVLTKLADFIENQHGTRRKIAMAAVYPAILTLLSIVIVIFLLNRVIPNILDVFVHSGQTLPTATQILLQVSQFVQQYGLAMIGLFIALAVGFWLWNQQPSRRRLTHQLWLRLPFIRRALLGFGTARFAGTLAMLCSSGVPMVEGMRTSSQVITHLIIRERLIKATTCVSEGSSLAAALKDTQLFSPMLLHMVANGETSGELEAMLTRAAQMQEQQLHSLIDTLLSLFEPLLLIIMGAVVLMIVMAVILPIVELNAGIG